MKVLITGASGGLGHYVCKAISSSSIDLLAPSHQEMDVSNFGQVEHYFQAHLPEIVIHLAAWTDARACEDNPKRAILVNTEGTRNIARLCRRFDAHLVYMSTDAVFSGNGPHSIDTVPCPESVYGWSKFAGERCVSMLEHRSIIRANFFTRACRGKRSFASYVIESAKEGLPFSCYQNVRSCPVFAETVAIRIVKAALTREFKTIHIASSHEVDRVVQAWYILGAYGLPSSNVQPIDARRAEDGRLLSDEVVGPVEHEIMKMVRAEPL